MVQIVQYVCVCVCVCLCLCVDFDLKSIVIDGSNNTACSTTREAYIPSNRNEGDGDSCGHGCSVLNVGERAEAGGQLRALHGRQLKQNHRTQLTCHEPSSAAVA